MSHVKLLVNAGSLLLMAAIAACGPDDLAQEIPELSTWMLGTWSTRAVGYVTNECGISQLKFQEDGTVLKGGASCGARPSFPTELTWERDGEDALIVTLPEDDYFDGHRITLGSHPLTLETDCKSLAIVDILNGKIEEATLRWYVRGSVCMNVLSGPCPEGQGSCEGYATVWCDEPPPPCEQAEAP